MFVLSAAVSSLFVTGVITNEKINGISKSYLLVGVRMRTYLLQWLAYFSLNAVVLAGLLTLVCIYFKLMPMSNGGLIYISNYLGLVQLYAMLILSMQFVNEEEMASAIVWLIAFFCMGVGSAIIVLESANHVALTVLSVLFPLIGMIQYFGIYITYDYTGFNTGIHPGMNVASSGLLSNMVAQMVGILFWIILISMYSSSWVRKNVLGMIGPRTEQIAPSLESEESDKFEPLSPDKEVVVSLRGVHHTYYPSRLRCNKHAEPVNVLSHLNMDVCRGEVLGFLGHNGAGKSTTVDILSTELALQNGRIIYHFQEGDTYLGGEDKLIKTRIGVCPQHNDSLQNDLTCRETLTLFARLKGGYSIMDGQTPDDAVAGEVERRLSDVKFTSDEDCDKPVGTFSGGMKRKVLIAVALLGDPEVVYLDEPTAGLDPFNRRVIWDMIIEAKQGRSIILTTHFLDEADVLSDRIGIIKKGRLVTCGSSLFLKHTLGAGYTLKFSSEESFDVSSLIQAAQLISGGGAHDKLQQWTLKFGAEKQIPDLLLALTDHGATDIQLELTTLEDVFLETGKEDFDEIDDSIGEEEDGGNEENNQDPETGQNKEERQAWIWEQRSTITPIAFFKKLRLVEHFARTNALKMKGAIFLNISMPMLYMVVGLVVVSLIENPTSGEEVANPPIEVSSPWISARFFGVENIQGNPIHPIQPVPEPMQLSQYFGDSMPIIGGHYGQNSTLQYAPDVDSFALQFGASIIANYSTLIDSNSSVDGVGTYVQQLPYVLDSTFRFDLLFLPMMLSFGFAGLAFTVLDVLLLKGNNIIELFRVGGITEWQTYMGVSAYKLAATFVPFFTLAIILCLSLKSVLFGNAGRWLGTILVMTGYAYSGTPTGLILAKKFIRGNFKETANWFPGVYYTFVALPYVAWSSALQAAPSAENVILIIGDILCIFPFFAFQRGLGAVIRISTEYNDPALSWANVWSFEARIWYTILLMFCIGSLQWFYLYKLTTRRAPKADLSIEEVEEFGTPIDISENSDIVEEYQRSRADDQGINARELVKAFTSKKKSKKRLFGKGSKQKVIKQAAKGVSFGIRKNEIYALLGPNGAGKSTVMNMLAAQLTPEHGEIALNGLVAHENDQSVDHLYATGDVAFCPQFDALFPKKTIGEHIQFYAAIRGLHWNEEATQGHLNAIVTSLGLAKHLDKESTSLSGGYKRRLCMAIALIGHPKLILLDECTTGLDPAARHLVWDILKPESKNGYDVPAVLLSSHYMDESEHLGTRIGIMIDGVLVASGSLNRLQELYCTGLFVEISLRPTVVDHTQAEVQAVDAFSDLNMDATVYESLPLHFKLKVKFQQGVEISNNITQLAQAFRLLETKKDEIEIQFYSVALMNLEQIFIELSRKQLEVDDAFHAWIFKSSHF
mmetsp:Transcript_18650/g.44881  ORF Transcript_18650/g.44881 Transcript_18650/m.44881 type:complete len:1405 (-) Transcript_18650:72-4286(-)